MVVLAAADGPRETAYRRYRILYYAVEPFTDGELPDILSAAFRSQERAAVERPSGPSEPISGISITNRYGHRVHLLAAPGLWWRNEGLGALVNQKLLARSPGDAMNKVTVLTVQPDAMGGLASLDARTTEALADHIVCEMAVY